MNRGGGGFGFTLSGNCPVFIRSVDPGGAASRMGLRPGDRILKLNGLDIRFEKYNQYNTIIIMTINILLPPAEIPPILMLCVS